MMRKKSKVLGMLLVVFVPMFICVGMIDHVEFTTTTSVLSLKSSNPIGGITATISSDKYTIDEDGLYVYTKTDVDENTILSNITVINGSISIEDSILYVSNVLPLEGNGKGDADGDGDVDFSDAFTITSYIANSSVEINEEFADANDDGKITAADAMLILTYANSEGEIGTVTSIGTGKGDVNMDGYIDADDAALVLKNVAGLEDLTDEQIEYADVNDDGNVSAVDARYILQFCLYYSEEAVAEYAIVNISSSKYEISGNEIIVDEGEFDESNIVVTNGEVEYVDGVLVIEYNGEEIDEYSVTIKTATTTAKEETTTEKKETNPSTTDMTVGNLIFIGGCLLLIVGYGLKRLKKVNK